VTYSEALAQDPVSQVHRRRWAALAWRPAERARVMCWPRKAPTRAPPRYRG